MSFLTLVAVLLAGQAGDMTNPNTGPEMPGYAWSTVDDSASKELFPGIRLHTLWSGENGASAHVVKLDAGSSWEGLDVHEPGPEEVFVVSGTFDDGVREYPAGTFIHAPAGSWHIPQTITGCTLFIFYPEG
jgi:hypothetical protein